ncbi:hypothetical protein R6Q57_002775 [Mikania cordata]
MNQPLLPTIATIIHTIYRRKVILRLLFSGIVLFLATQIYLSITTNTTAGARYRKSWKLEIDDLIVQCYTIVFQNLIDSGFLTGDSKTLAVGTQFLELTGALNESGVKYSKTTKRNDWIPYDNHTFDVEFCTHTSLDYSLNPGGFSSELSRTLKPDGYLIIHTESKDSYSLNSLLDLFDSFKLIRSREIDIQHWSIQGIHEIVLKKQNKIIRRRRMIAGSCSVPAYKKRLIQDSEPLVFKEPLNPCISIKNNFENVKNMRYLPLMADISFKTQYVYIDVGAKGYGSSIGGWFKKLYPKQEKPFKIFAIEADKQFHEEYKSKKKITLLPYEPWVRNESLFFEINRVSNGPNEERGRGMGRVQSAQTSSPYMGDINKIQGFDFADWMKNSFGEKDFVVVKMDVDGTEFDLIKKMIENGAICLIDEMFLECHYDRKQRCSDGERSSRYQNGYEECMKLYSSLREKGVLVHQW